jgi:hypothetical protein
LAVFILCPVQPDFRTKTQAPENKQLAFGSAEKQREGYDGISMNQKDMGSGGHYETISELWPF